LKPEWCGSPLVQEEKACDKRQQKQQQQQQQDNNNIDGTEGTLIELIQRMDNLVFECCLSSHRGIWSLLPLHVQCLPKLEFRKS